MVAVDPIQTEVLEDHRVLAGTVGGRIAELIQSRRRENRTVVLGLATGSTPLGVYRELIRLHQAGKLSFANVVTFNLDEYYPMAPDRLHAFRRFMRENLFDHVDLDPSNTHGLRGDVPRAEVAAECARYEAAIRDAGGIDFQLLGIGKTGHIGFNEPGSSAESRTRLVSLDLTTRRDAAADFFGEENVPREALTMGVATILEAREIAL
ncbi:MAG: 6-phosphogluconolactonase, partial [Gemmatimonadales bacterium]